MLLMSSNSDVLLSNPWDGREVARVNGVELGYGLAGLAMLFVGIVLAILWICVPFAVFGIKPILQDIRMELRRANELSEQQQASSHPRQATLPRPAPTDDNGTGTLGTIRAAIKQADQR